MGTVKRALQNDDSRLPQGIRKRSATGQRFSQTLHRLPAWPLVRGRKHLGGVSGRPFAATALWSRGESRANQIDIEGAVKGVFTAGGALIEDLSTTAFTLIDNLKIDPAETTKAMDMLTKAARSIR